MNTPSKSMQIALLIALLVASGGALVTAGYPAEAQSAITVDLANGGGYVLAETAVAPVPMTVVPNVLDEPLNMAREDIEAAGLRPKWGGGIGPVVFQAPKAGTSVPVGSTVTFVLGNN